jgi:hypothetical protein
MTYATSRRRFLSGAARAAAAGGLANLFGPAAWSPLSAEEAAVTPDLVQLRPEMKPLVKLIEETPREKCPAMLAEQLQKGVPYRQLLAAAFLVAVQRGGHHEVYLIHAAHQLSLDVGPQERSLPLFWGVDVIKEHLARFKSEPVKPLRGELPSPQQADVQFDTAMREWDQEQAERALLALARQSGPRVAMEKLWPYAARDWSFIGHLAISVAHCWRTLQTIGWQHADPVLSFVIRDLHRWSNKNLRDQPYAANVDRVQRSFAALPRDWASGKADVTATRELLNVIRTGRWDDACEWTSSELTRGVGAGTVWDAVHLAAAEFMIRFKLGGRRITNRALHSNTSANSLHYAFRTCLDPQSRYLILLQAVGWVTGFLQNEQSRNMLRDLSITTIPEIELPEDPAAAIEAIFGVLPPRSFLDEIENRSHQDEASRLAYAYGRAAPEASHFLRTARRLLCTKATLNAHDVKFPVAIFEDLDLVSAAWRPHLLAGSVHFLHGPKSEDNPAIRQAMERLS